MEKVQGYVEMNEYMMKLYMQAYDHRNNENDVVRYCNIAYGAFEMFKLLYPDYLAKEQFDSFWEFYRHLFEAIM